MMKPFGSYCQATRHGDLVMTAGVAAIDRHGKIVGGNDIVAQTRATLENLRYALEAAGARIESVMKVTVYLTSFDNYKGFNQAFDEFFADCRPARSTVRADLVLPELLVEIDAIAVSGNETVRDG
ncbi:MAG: RidA family protein [Parvibaculaceae bacterium]